MISDSGEVINESENTLLQLSLSTCGKHHLES